MAQRAGQKPFIPLVRGQGLGFEGYQRSNERSQVQRGQTVPISSTGGGGGAASFATLTGAPEDNAALDVALDGKQPVGAYLTSITGGMVTSALGYTPTSVTGLTGVQSVAAFKAGLSLAKADVGLSNVDNTTDLLKPISTATQTALNGKQASGTYATGSGSASGTNTGDQFTNMTSSRILGRVTGGFGAAEELTAAQIRTLLALVPGTDVQAFDQQLTDLAGLSYGSNALKVVRVNAGATAFELATPAGGADPWTTVKLALDYTNATTTFATITDGTTPLTFTPPANTDWEMEARLLVWTTTIANLPRVGFLVAAGGTRGYGGVNIWQAGATATASVHANGAWSDASGITTLQLAAGGVLTASVPYICEVICAGRSGASPTAISLQMAAETAGASICYIKRGSFLKYRTF